MSSDVPAVPPWRPIADWLARLPQEPDDGQPEPTGNATQRQIHKRYEMPAKAIAYDIATDGVDADE